MLHTDVDLEFSQDGTEFKAKTSWVNDNVPCLTYAKMLRENGGNGFWNKRSGRHIASVPAFALALAERQGINTSDQKQLREWLDQHPQYWTVEHILTPGKDPRNIIK